MANSAPVQPTVLTFDTLPPVVPSFARAVTTRRAGLRGDARLGRFEATIANVAPEPQRLADFQELIRWPRPDEMPPTYPHALVGPVHVAMLTHSSFPLRPIGIIHLYNRIEQRAAIPQDRPITFHVEIDGHEDTPAGRVFELRTDALVDGEKLWSEITGILSRTPNARGSVDPPPPVPEVATTRSTFWQVPGNTGRRYSAVSRDFNPIHLFPITALPFGFKRPIAHGMWTLGRALAELDRDLYQGPVAIDVAFRRPLLLPSRVGFRSWSEGDACTFSVNPARGKTPHLVGSARPLADG